MSKPKATASEGIAGSRPRQDVSRATTADAATVPPTYQAARVVQPGRQAHSADLPDARPPPRRGARDASAHAIEREGPCGRQRRPPCARPQTATSPGCATARSAAATATSSSPWTIRSYEKALRLRVLPELGDSRLSETCAASTCKTSPTTSWPNGTRAGLGLTVTTRCAPSAAAPSSAAGWFLNPCERGRVPAVRNGRVASRRRRRPPKLLAALPAEGPRALGYRALRGPATRRADGAPLGGRRPQGRRHPRATLVGRAAGPIEPKSAPARARSRSRTSSATTWSTTSSLTAGEGPSSVR